MDLNKAMIIGRATRDLELRTTPNGRNVTSFSLATNYAWVDKEGQKQEKVEFHNIVAWGKLAEICAQYVTRGKRIYVEGRLQTHDWEGQDGVKRYRTEVIADNMILLDSPRGSQQNQPATPPTPTAPSNPTTINPETSPMSPASDTEEEIKVEDIPF